MIIVVLKVKKYSYLSCTSARPIGAEVEAGLISVDPTDSGDTQHTEPTIDSASSLQIVLVSLRTLLASEIINQTQKIISVQQFSIIYDMHLRKKNFI